MTLEGVEEDDDEEEELSPSSWHKMTTTLEISVISANGYKSRHSQPECGYALDPSQWTEYSIHTMDPDNLELTFEFFEVILIGILPPINPFLEICNLVSQTQIKKEEEKQASNHNCINVFTGGPE